MLPRHGPHGAAVRVGTRMDQGLAGFPRESSERARFPLLPAPVEPRRARIQRPVFCLRAAHGFRTDGNLLRFTSAVETPHPENNRVHGQWFPAKHKPGSRRVATLVLPHWNASATQHNALCVGLAKLGISALRLSPPYHDYRMPAELKRADYAVSSNIARTIDATRQAVIDTRSAVDWLVSEGSNASASWAPAWVPAMRSWRARTTRASR